MIEYAGDREATSRPTLTLIALCPKDTPGKIIRSFLDVFVRVWMDQPTAIEQKGNNRAYQMNSEHIEQKVGWRKKVAMNLCPLIS